MYLSLILPHHSSKLNSLIAIYYIAAEVEKQAALAFFFPRDILDLQNYYEDIAMNIEAYDLDSLRKLVRELQAENRSLRELLSEKRIPCDINSAFQSDAQAPEMRGDPHTTISARFISVGIRKDIFRYRVAFWKH